MGKKEGSESEAATRPARLQNSFEKQDVEQEHSLLAEPIVDDEGLGSPVLQLAVMLSLPYIDDALPIYCNHRVVLRFLVLSAQEEVIH